MKDVINEISRIHELMGLEVLTEAPNPIIQLIKNAARGLESQVQAVTGKELKDLTEKEIPLLLKSANKKLREISTKAWGITKGEFNAKTYDELVQDLAQMGVSKGQINRFIKNAGEDFGEPRGGYPQPKPKTKPSVTNVVTPEVVDYDKLTDDLGNALTNGETESLTNTFINQIKSKGGQISRAKEDEIKMAVEQLNQRIKVTYDKMRGVTRREIDDLYSTNPDIKELSNIWTKIPVKKQKEIITQLNKEMEAAFGDWVMGLRISPDEKNILLKFFHNFWWKKGIMLDMKPTNLAQWFTWWFKSSGMAMLYMTTSEVISCWKLGKDCPGILTKIDNNLKDSVIPFWGPLTGSFLLGKTSLESLLRGVKLNLGLEKERESGLFSKTFTAEEAKDFVENKDGLKDKGFPISELQNQKLDYKEGSKSNEIDFYVNDSKVGTLEKVWAANSELSSIKFK